MKQKSVRDQLATFCTADRLTHITSVLVGAYRTGSISILRLLARSLPDWIEDADGESSRLFSQLMLLYHPDRLRRREAEIRQAKESGDEDGLMRILCLFTAFDDVFEKRSDHRKGRAEKATWDSEERWADEEIHTYGEEDFDEVHSARESWFGAGFAGSEYEDTEVDASGEMYEDAEQGASLESEDSGRRSLFDALYAREYGLVSTEFSPRHLEFFEGEMNLSDYEITDLDGAAHLTRIRVLQLSENRIRNLSPLCTLVGLEELYLASNQLEDLQGIEGLQSLRILDLENNAVSDLGPILELRALEYVNLIGNPVRFDQVRALRSRGVIVIATEGKSPESLPF